MTKPGWMGNTGFTEASDPPEPDYRNGDICKARVPALRQAIWETGTGDARVLDGMASRMDRFKATGNGQVPLVAATAWRILTANNPGVRHGD
jgi:hypothetical protein